jgi:AsmA protein
MKAWKYVVYAVAGVLVLLIVAVGIFVATFDPNTYRPQIVAFVKEKTGRTLAIGDIGLKLFPKIGAQVRQVALSEREGSGEFAGVEEAQVYLSLLPLIRREVVVDEVRLDGLRANLVKYKNGTTNFDDLTKLGEGGAAPEKPAPETGGGKPLKFDVDGVRVTNSQVHWRDETSGNDIVVALHELRTGRIAENRPSRIALTATLKGAQPVLDLGTQASGELTFNLAGQRYRVAGLDAKLTGSAMDFSGIDVGVRGDVDARNALVNVSGLALDGKAQRGADRYAVKATAPSVQSGPQELAVKDLTLSASGAMGGMEVNDSKLAAPLLRVNLADNRVLIDGLKLTARGKAQGDALDVHLSAPKLAVTPESASGDSLLLQAKLSGAQRKADVSLRLSAVEGTAKALKVQALTMDLDARQNDTAVKGTLSTPLVGDLQARSFQLPRIAGRFAVTSAAIPQKTVQVPVDGSLRADLGKEMVSADLASKFDESNIKAKLAMAGFATPAYDFDVVIDRLNVDKYLPADKPAAETAAGAEPTPAKQGQAKQAEEPIDLSALKTLDIDGSVKIGELQANNVKASNVRMDLRAKGGKLTVNPLAANLYEGSLKGSATIDANTNLYAVKQTLSGISIGPLLRDAAQTDLVEGRGALALDLSTQGNVLSAMKRALDGSARLQLKDGAVKGIDLAGAVRSVKAMLAGKDVEGQAASQDKTDFSELSATFTVKDGVAYNEDLDLKSPFIRVRGAGSLNIPQETLDYVVKTSIVGTMKGQGGADIAELRGLTIPVRVAGTFDQLTYKVEFSQMVRGATREQLEAVKKQGAEALKEAARSKLDELLGSRGGAGGSPDGAPADGAKQSARAKKPEEVLKERLKGLLGR